MVDKEDDCFTSGYHILIFASKSMCVNVSPCVCVIADRSPITNPFYTKLRLARSIQQGSNHDRRNKGEVNAYSR